jgi:hypothetical protein
MESWLTFFQPFGAFIVHRSIIEEQTHPIEKILSLSYKYPNNFKKNSFNKLKGVVFLDEQQ